VNIRWLTMRCSCRITGSHLSIAGPLQNLLVALQKTLAQYLGGPVAMTPSGSDSDEPLIVFDVVNDVRPNRSPT
jgi:hypothetical protein